MGSKLDEGSQLFKVTTVYGFGQTDGILKVTELA
jgi:hypothetical protein